MTRALILAAFLLSLFAAGCAYFNLFYNAQKAFEEAEEMGEDVDPREQPTGNQKSKYRICIDKCALVLEEYPGSDYVDDALFLMGKSFFRLRDPSNYRSAIYNFDSVLANFPNSPFAAEALYLKSLAHLALGEEQIALDNLARLEGREGGSRFAIEAKYRLGDTYLERRDYATALGYYDDYLSNHPKHEMAATVALHKAGAEFELEHYEAAVATVDAMNMGRATRRERFDAKFLRARALHRLDRSEEAAVALAEIEDDAAMHRQGNETQLLRGEIELSRGREEEGLELLRGLIEANSRKPIDSQSRLTIANYYLRRFGPGDQRLMEELDAAIASNAGGDAMIDLRKLRKRVESYRELHERLASDESDSLKAVAAFTLGELLLTELDRPREALGSYQRALASDYVDEARGARAAYACVHLYDNVLAEPDSANIARELLRSRFPDSPQARSLEGELFLTARPRTEEEIAAIMAGDLRGGPNAGPGAASDGSSRSGRRRSLARGGPGATQPREGAVR